ncbi:MAG: AAA family ATPase [Desulfobacteraceae bacterium]|nr:AAA family ATPase [Desulfobacteraceae bacterium]
MKIKSLSLRSIGPFIEADMEFFDDSDEKPPIVLISGENGTGKSIILDAIRGMFGENYCKLSRNISRKEPKGSYITIQIPVSECLDPCDLTENPADHLTFDKEIIRSKNASPKGMKTIQKYKLDRGESDHLRRKQLVLFYETLIKLQQRQIDQGRKSLTRDELEILRSFKQTDHAFSLMLSLLLAKIGY